MPTASCDLQQYRSTVAVMDSDARRLVVDVIDKSEGGIVSFILSTSRHGRASSAHRHAGCFIFVSFSPYYLKESSLEEVVFWGTI